MRMKGKTIVDATRKVSTTITASDLAKAVPTNDHHCAIAESLRRSKGGIEQLSIGACIVYVTYTSDPDTVVRYHISANDRALIRAFDVQGAFPCGYKVTLLPPPAKRLLGARKGERHGTNKRSGKGKSALNRATRRIPTRHISAPA